MATPTRSRHVVAGTLGDILVDVRAGGRDSPRPAVVVVHGFKGFKDWGMFPPLAERLARAGFSAVTFNLSGSGADDAGAIVHADRFARNTYGAELRDVGAVIDALHDGRLGVVAPTAVGLLGHSRGGGIAVLQTARDRRVASLVTWAAIADTMRWSAVECAAWRARGTLAIANSRTGQVIDLTTDLLDEVESAPAALDILAAASTVAVPWLIVHGAADEAVDPEDARRMYVASGRAGTELLEVPGAGHTFGAAHPWVAPPPGAPIERVFDATLRWFAASLR